MACLFCGAASPVTAIQCVQCHEIFQGMAERKQARDRQQQTQSVIDGVVSVVGSIAGAVSGHSVNVGHAGGSAPQPQPQYDAQPSYSAGADPNAPRMPDK
jgi:hypothetical protein